MYNLFLFVLSFYLIVPNCIGVNGLFLIYKFFVISLILITSHISAYIWIFPS